MEDKNKKALAAILIILLIALGGYFGLKYLHEQDKLPDAVENIIFGDGGETDTTTPNNPDPEPTDPTTPTTPNNPDPDPTDPEPTLVFSVIHNETALQGGYSWQQVYGSFQRVRYHTGTYPNVTAKDVNAVRVFLNRIGEQVDGNLTLKLVTANGTVGASKTLSVSELRQQIAENCGAVMFNFNNTVSSATYNWVEFDFSQIIFTGDITGAGSLLEMYWQGSHVSQYGHEDRGIIGGWLDGSGGGGLNPQAGFFPNFELWFIGAA